MLHHLRLELGDDLPKTVAVQGMGIDPNDLKRDTPYKPYDGNAKLRIFSCGRLHFVKGHQHLISAAAELRERGIELEVYIAGQDVKQPRR